MHYLNFKKFICSLLFSEYCEKIYPMELILIYSLLIPRCICGGSFQFPTLEKGGKEGFYN
jgi:hypothetical protein